MKSLVVVLSLALLSLAAGQNCGLDGKCDPDPNDSVSSPQQSSSATRRVSSSAAASRRPPSPGVYYIFSDANDKVLDFDMQRREVILHPHNGGENQKWRIDERGVIENVASGSVLDVWTHEQLTQSSPAKGGRRRQQQQRAQTETVHDLITHERNGGLNQQWTFTRDGSIKSKANQLALDVWESPTSATVILFEAHGKANQRWRVESTSSQAIRSRLAKPKESHPKRRGRTSSYRGGSGDSADL